MSAAQRTGSGADAAAPPLLELRGVRKTFPRAAAAGGELVAVDDVSLRLGEGGALAVVGESGSGKSTLARIVCGLLAPDAGALALRGVERSQPPRGRAQRLARAREVQLVFQDPYLSLDPRVRAGRCVEEVLQLHFPERPRAWRQERVAALIEAIGLRPEQAQALPRELSGGERQRVAIARALAMEPSLLVLDEAVSALDVSTQWRILQLLQRLRDELGLAYLFVTHDLGVARELCAEAIVMLRGRVVEHGPVAQVLERPQHDYTRLLLDSIPREGWEPEAVLGRRAALAEGAAA